MRRVVASIVAFSCVMAWAAPASAGRPSPRPTATLIGTGTITVGESEESYIEVNARDVDGIITEIEIRWGDGSISFAHSYPCLIPPTPEPGDTHRFLVSNPYEEPGRYTVRFVVYSISDCGFDPLEQHSRPYVTRLAAS